MASGKPCNFSRQSIPGELIGYDYSLSDLDASVVEIASSPFSQLPALTLDITQQYASTVACNDATPADNASTFTIGANPSHGLVRMYSNDAGVMRIYNAIGQLVLATEGGGIFTIDMREFSDGAYVAVFSTGLAANAQIFILKK
jgi:hypothetical protein